jgi:hypothetical protein
MVQFFKEIKLRFSQKLRYTNIRLDIEELEKRLGTPPFANSREIWKSTWSIDEDHAASQICQKISMARKELIDLEPKLSSMTTDSAAQSLELIQNNINSAYSDLQALMAGLMIKQGLETPTNNAPNP